MSDFMTLFLAVYFVLFFGLVFVWRTWRAWKQTGINPYRLLHNPGAEAVIGRYFKLLPLLSLLVGVLYIRGEQAYAYLAPFQWLEYEWLAIAGVVLMVIALLLILIAQSQMGESWRIGVDYENTTEMVSRGLFNYSRNPIFAGIVLSVVGFFLALPNAVTLLIVMLDVLLVEVQVRLEEERLAQLHGQSYADYCSRVRRWI